MDATRVIFRAKLLNIPIREVITSWRDVVDDERVGLINYRYKHSIWHLSGDGYDREADIIYGFTTNADEPNDGVGINEYYFSKSFT